MKKFTLLLLLLLALPASLSAQQSESTYKVIWDNDTPFACRLTSDWYHATPYVEIVKPETNDESLIQTYYAMYGEIAIPSTVTICDEEGNETSYPVLKIARDAFDGMPMSSVYVPTSITHIYGNPFKNCPNLTEFKGDWATDDGLFLICFLENDPMGYDPKRTVIVAFANAGAPDNYELKLTTVKDYQNNRYFEIGEEAFRNATKLKSVTLDGLMSLRKDCFRGCTNLKEIKGYSSFNDGRSFGRATYYNESDWETTTGTGFFKECPNIEYFHFYDDMNLMFGNVHLPNEQDMDHIPILIAARECFGNICNDDYWKNAPCMLSVNIPEEIKIENFHEPTSEKTATVFANIEKGAEDFEIAWNFPTTEIISAEDTETIGEKKLTANKLGRADFSLTLRQKTSDALLANVRKAPSQYSPLTLSSTMKITTPTGINSIDADNQEVDADAIYYSVNGMQVDKENLAPGIYIARGSKTSKKILVK